MKMPRFITALLIMGCFSVHLPAQVVLPQTMRLAGPLDAAESEFGDRFVNFPFGDGVGLTPIRGWIEIAFSPPDEDDISEFTLTWNAVGEGATLVFEDGHFNAVDGEQTYSSAVQVSRGELNVQTGEVEAIEIHAVFLNTVIHKIVRDSRFPLSSSPVSGFFSPLNSDYPALDPPVTIPFDERPDTFGEARFIFDANRRIAGFVFEGVGFAPLSILPRVGFFPGYSFGDQGLVYFSSPDGCLPGTIPPEECVTKETAPDGVVVPEDGYLNPNLTLASRELREVSEESTVPPCLMEAVAEAGATTIGSGELLYLIGGSAAQGSTDAVQVFSPDASQWSEGPSLPVPIRGGAAAALGHRIYLAGGLSGDNGVPVNRLHVLDTETGVWSVIDSMPVATTSAVAEAVAGRIFVLGGLTIGSGDLVPTDSVQIYDPQSGSWSSGSPLPVATAGSASAVVNSDIYVINGRTAEGTVTDAVWIHDTETDSWRQGPSTQWGVYGGSADYLNNRIYLVGGRRSVDGPVDVSQVLFNQQRMQVLELALDEWVLGIEPPFATSDEAVLASNGRVYVAGGYTGRSRYPGNMTRIVQAYLPDRGWRICNSEPLFTADHVVGSAALGVGPVHLSPGAQATIVGYNFATVDSTAFPVRWQGGVFTTDLPTNLKGISVKVDGHPAPILAVGPRRVDFQVPYEVSATTVPRMVRIELVKEGLARQPLPVEVSVVRAAPGIYTYSHGELRALVYQTESAAIAYNADGKLNYPSQPALAGEVLSFRAAALGPVSLALETGRRASAESANPAVLEPTVYVDGLKAEVVSVGLLPNEVGVFTVQVVVPEGSRKGNLVPIEIELDGIRSNLAVVSVR